MALKDLAKLIARSNEEKTPEQEFLFQLNEAISRLKSESPYIPSKTFKPSSLGGCLRKVYFEVTGAERDQGFEEASGVGILESGTDRHERIQKAIFEMNRLGYEVEWVDVEEYLKIRPQPGTIVKEKKGMETKLYNEVLNLSFLCDGIIKFKGRYYILEIKTEVDFKWNGRVQPVDKHIVQAASYSVSLGIDEIFFIYENRNFCNKKIFSYTVSTIEKEELVLNRIETVNNHIEEGTKPEKTTVQSECNYCKYKGECKKW